MNILNNPIPAIDFPESNIPVLSPVDDPLVYLDNYFLCDSKYNHWIENDGKPLPGSSPSITIRSKVARMLRQLLGNELLNI